MKLLRGLCIVALAIAFTIPVYAETQSIKLSGDLAIRYIMHDDYDFDAYKGDTSDTDSNYFMHNAEVQLDADLTDNVSVTIRLVNQTDWDVSYISGEGGNFIDQDWNQAVAGGGPDGALDHYGEFDVLLDLGYITLKEFFFTPLTVRIGKQDLWFGKGFIIGANYDDPNGQIEADEFTSFKSFKAIRATWDYEPWTFDAVYAMIEENEVQADDDRDLIGVNLGIDLSEYKNAEVELYSWLISDEEQPVMQGSLAVSQRRDNQIYTFGTRGSFDPHEDITLYGEIAAQTGTFYAHQTQGEPRRREAYALDIGGDIRMWEEQYAWRPVIGAEYIFYSGQDSAKNHEGSDFHNWNRVFRGKVDSAIHEWYNVFYVLGMPTAERADQNLHQIILKGSIQPMDNLTVDARFINFRLHEAFPIVNVPASNTMGSEDKNVGNELDIELMYEYTEDVTFGLLGAWFWAGDYYAVPEKTANASVGAGGAQNKEKAVANEVVATCKVSF